MKEALKYNIHYVYQTFIFFALARVIWTIFSGAISQSFETKINSVPLNNITNQFILEMR